jgi:uncharacterized protein YecT (DUF1311 family)
VLLIGLIALAAPVAGRCPDANTTIEINACLAARAKAANAEMARYLAAARGRAGEESAEVVKAFDLAQTRWLAYRTADCDAVYANWQGGSIRGAMSIGCQIDLTEARTHWLWKTWLTYMDSTPPTLPEPKLSADGTS